MKAVPKANGLLDHGVCQCALRPIRHSCSSIGPVETSALDDGLSVFVSVRFSTPAIKFSHILLIICVITIHVQAEQLSVKTYTMAEGLAHDRLLRIYRDSHGLLWFCTADGLSKFDGYRFTTYRLEQGLPFPRVNDIRETRGGDYWVATNGGGVSHFNPALGIATAQNHESRAVR